MNAAYLIKVMLIVCLLIYNTVYSGNSHRKTNESKSNIIETLRKELKEKEEKLDKELKEKEEKLENVNRGFERMIQLMNIFNQIDHFLSEKAKKMAKTLVVLVDDDERLKKTDLSLED
ncbi:hypothetical protein QE152_g29555 [Popillia japonica]|uniref:Uncharacterized protein n=1 Tax=Popillia japonica TaxID=7064 RepID=A0AAW1JHQ1_POPJA